MEEEFFADSLIKAVIFAPCTILETGVAFMAGKDSLFQYQDYGIYNILGPGWKQNIETICDKMGIEACEFAKELGDVPVDIPHIRASFSV